MATSQEIEVFAIAYVAFRVGVVNFSINIQAHLRFKRIVSCCFRNKRMRLKTRAYGIR